MRSGQHRHGPADRDAAAGGPICCPGDRTVRTDPRRSAGPPPEGDRPTRLLAVADRERGRRNHGGLSVRTGAVPGRTRAVRPREPVRRLVRRAVRPDRLHAAAVQLAALRPVPLRHTWLSGPLPPIRRRPPERHGHRRPGAGHHRRRPLLVSTRFHPGHPGRHLRRCRDSAGPSAGRRPTEARRWRP